MVDEDPEPDPKPLVDYAYIDDYVEEKPDILDLYDKQDRLTRGFGKKGPPLNKEIVKEIHNIHKRPDLKEFYVPYDLDMNAEDKNLIGPPIPKDFNPNANDDDDLEDDYSNKPTNYNQNNKNEKVSKKLLKNVNVGRQEDSDESMQSADEEEEEVDSLEKSIPISHLVELTHTEFKAVNSLDIDRSGNRLITGSFDGTIKIWDFNNMTRRPAPIQTIECCLGFPVLGVSWAPSGGFFLACTGDCQAKVYDRDGNFEIGCLKGDNYLHDINNTKGHTYPLTDGKFHPKERNLFITSSRDSTIREWDIYSKPMGIDQEIMQSTVLRAKTFKHHKITVNSCAKLEAKLEGPDQALLVKSVNTIVNQVQAMQQLVNEFRDYARLPAAQLKPLDLNTLLTEVLALYGSAVESGRLRVEAGTGLPRVQGDATQLRQVIHNLLQNALDAVAERPDGLVRVATEALLNEQGGVRSVRLRILDNGPGFADKVLKRAFEPYITTKAKGTGLGLAVVKKIADEHAARVRLSNWSEPPMPHSTMPAKIGGAQVSLSFSKLAPPGGGMGTGS